MVPYSSPSYGPLPLLSLSIPPPSLIPTIISLNKASVLDRRRQKKELTRKTVVCRAWEEKGRCNYGVKCKFAHGVHELKTKTETVKEGQSSYRYRTQPCLKYTLLGSCPYEDRCTYLHGQKVDVEGCIDELLSKESSPPLNCPSLPFDPFHTPSDQMSPTVEIRPMHYRPFF